MGPNVRTARCCVLDLIFELPYGPAAIYWPQQRPDRWLHPDYALNFSEKHLAPGWASTDGPQKTTFAANSLRRLGWSQDTALRLRHVNF